MLLVLWGIVGAGHEAAGACMAASQDSFIYSCHTVACMFGTFGQALVDVGWMEVVEPGQIARRTYSSPWAAVLAARR
jgi:hypothetical protein